MQPIVPLPNEPVYEAAIDLDNLAASTKLIHEEIDHYLELRNELIAAVQRNPNWSLDTLVNMICEVHDTPKAFMDYYASFHTEAIKDSMRTATRARQRKPPK